MINDTKIFINGSWHYVTDQPKKIVDLLISYKRTGIIHIFTSIVWKIQDYIIEIYTDAGRCIRPVYTVDDNKLVINNDTLQKIDTKILTWNNLIVGGLNQNNSLH